MASTSKDSLMAKIERLLHYTLRPRGNDLRSNRERREGKDKEGTGMSDPSVDPLDRFKSAQTPADAAKAKQEPRAVLLAANAGVWLRQVPQPRPKPKSAS
jgi:hypothetical protein